MSTRYVVTVLTEIDFVGTPEDDVLDSHLERLVERVREAAEGLSTRVTAAVRVPYCGGGRVPDEGGGDASGGPEWEV